MIKTVLIVDVETTGTDREKDRVIEYGYVLWSVRHRTILSCHSELLHADSNPAEHVNGIPVAALGNGNWVMFANAVKEADAIVAHQADFDRSFTPAYKDDLWICTREDMRWPKASPSTSLTAIALAHGCAVVAAHRAINDCLLLARLFEAVPDIDERLNAAAEHAKLPKGEVISLAPFEEKDIVKQHGFHWHPDRKAWSRFMTLADAAELPFRTRVA